MIVVADAPVTRVCGPSGIVYSEWDCANLQRWYIDNPHGMQRWLDEHLIISVMKEEIDYELMKTYLDPA